MTDEQINTAIAEACGWKMITTKDCEGYPHGIDPNGDMMHTALLPNYCGDLNAMHEAEKVLTTEQLYMFSEKLDTLMDKAPRRFGNNMPWAAHKVTATAAQRAEAFLRTLGKWEPEETK